MEKNKNQFLITGRIVEKKTEYDTNFQKEYEFIDVYVGSENVLHILVPPYHKEKAASFEIGAKISLTCLSQMKRIKSPNEKPILVIEKILSKPNEKYDYYNCFKICGTIVGIDLELSGSLTIQVTVINKNKITNIVPVFIKDPKRFEINQYRIGDYVEFRGKVRSFKSYNRFYNYLKPIHIEKNVSYPRLDFNEGEKNDRI